MKAINKIFITCFFIILLFACNRDEVGVASVDYNFVRFALQVNSKGQIVKYPQVTADIAETNTYIHTSTDTIKIPIAITSSLKDKPIEVNYEVTTEGSFTGYEFNYPNKIAIPAGKLVDTLRISFKSRWKAKEVNSIQLKITSTNDPSISVGYPNKSNKMDVLKITLGNLPIVNYSFEKNFYEIQGNINEELLIPIQFTQFITNEMIKDFEFIETQFSSLSVCEGLGSSYKYSLERLPFADGTKKIVYKLTILEQNPFSSRLALVLKNGLEDFEKKGTIQADINKGATNNRVGDVASNWYNTSDAFYRTFGKAWYYDTAAKRCRWSNTFNTFTKPVAVAPGSEFDNGKGYHKYRIGFVGNNPPNGTNPFDFRRFYNSDVTFRTDSPAYNITEALEFFPENGNNTTKGIVKVLSQTLTFIKKSNGQSIQVPICGSGNYYYNTLVGRWEMYLEIHCDETAINGNNDVIRAMYIYSNNVSTPDPTNLLINCSNRLTL